MYAKNIINAPINTPLNPFGAKGVQFSGLTKNAPAKTNNAITASFTKTIIAAILVESFVPLIKIKVIAITIKIAGRFIEIGTPKNVGITE